MTSSFHHAQVAYFDVGIVGNGPRGAALNMHAIAVALAEFRQFDKIQRMGPLKIRFQTFDKKPWSERAVGQAFSPSCHGMINTTPIGPEHIFIPNIHSEVPKFSRIISCATDLRSQVQEYALAHRKDLLAEYMRVSTAAAAAFQHATRKDGTIDISLPCVTRGTKGKVMQSQFDTVMKEGAQEVPFLEFQFSYDTEIIGTDLTTNRLRPVLTAMNTKTGKVTNHTFDHVIFAEGTIGEDPVSDNLKKRTYLGHPNFDDMQTFYNNLDLLADDGRLDPKARVLILGMSQSAIDKVTVGTRATGLATVSETDPSMLEWDEARVAQYAGTFTMMSRNSKPYSGPRHVNTWQWPEHAIFPLTRLMFRSGLVQNGGSTFSNSLSIMFAAAARALSTVPKKNPAKLRNIPEFQEVTLSENQKYFRSNDIQEQEQTWSGLLRAGIIFLTTAVSPKVQFRVLDTLENEEFRQLTAGRDGWMVFRSLASLHSTVKNNTRSTSPEFFRDWNDLMYPYAAAAPVCVSQYLASLFKKNVISHVESSYSQLGICQKTGKVTLGDKTFDCVLGSPILPINGNPKPKPCHPGVKEVLPNKPSFSKGRIYETKSGELCAATELGMVGHGLLAENSNGEPVIQEPYWMDTHSHAGVVQLTPTIAKYIFCKAALKASGCEDPAASIQQRYSKSQLSDQAYSEALRPMSVAHVEFHSVLAYCDFCREFAGPDEEKYARAFDQIGSASSRNAFVQQHDDGPGSCGSTYFERVRNIPEFKPKSKQQYYEEWIDFTPEEMHFVWNDICEELGERLGEGSEQKSGQGLREGLGQALGGGLSEVSSEVLSVGLGEGSQFSLYEPELRVVPDMKGTIETEGCVRAIQV